MGGHNERRIFPLSSFSFLRDVKYRKQLNFIFNKKRKIKKH
jgi:hypothetical protein